MANSPWCKSDCSRSALHPVWLRCSSLKYSRYSRSSRLASRAHRRPRCDAGLSPRAARATSPLRSSALLRGLGDDAAPRPLDIMAAARRTGSAGGGFRHWARDLEALVTVVTREFINWHRTPPVDVGLEAKTDPPQGIPRTAVEYTLLVDQPRGLASGDFFGLRLDGIREAGTGFGSASRCPDA